ncbi:MAG: pyridoxamine 5'-phosphate oxidase [Betaproteobacteria bacterium]|nr:pyridoxamine 5'-phosphate oxidase [Betaproteobacteria bacterium]
MKIAELRREYMRAGLSEAQADANPIKQFEKWFEDALQAGVPLPNAMTLATVAADGTPSARIVLLKGIEQEAFVFFTNYGSRKGRELAARSAACLVFFWSDLERQVRVDGRVEKIAPEASDAYYASRPLGARISAWASPQSEPVADRSALEASFKRFSSQHGDAPPRPPHWGGYRVVPQAIEFWQGRADRLHDRLAYERKGADGWTLRRLAP